jgi:hypothetical protein
MDMKFNNEKLLTGGIIFFLLIAIFNLPIFLLQQKLEERKSDAEKIEESSNELITQSNEVIVLFNDFLEQKSKKEEVDSKLKEFQESFLETEILENKFLDKEWKSFIEENKKFI